MGRKKSTKNNDKKSQKEKREEDDLENDEVGVFSIDPDAKRGIIAIILFFLALITVLGFFGFSGSVGNYFNKISGNIFGWAKLIFPIFAIYAGVVLLFRKATFFYVTKIIGLSIILIFLTGFFHWFYEIAEMEKMAASGSGGGYVGYFVAYFFIKYFGQVGSLIAIVAAILIGIIITFEFSIANLILHLKKIKNKEAENEGGTEIIQAEENIQGSENKATKEEEENSLEKQEIEEADLKNNIAKIEFVEGRDQYVSKNLLGNEIDKSDIEREFEKGKTKSVRRGKWKLPSISLLDIANETAVGGDIESRKEIIATTLKNFGIDVEPGEVKVGPAVTQFSYHPAVGVKISKIMTFQDDLALALASHPIRIEAPIPGKSLIGVEVPNKSFATVRLREMLEGDDFKNRKNNLSLALGKNVNGEHIFRSIENMPHLMIAGSTNTGKSVCVNSIITALLYQNSPDDLKFIMIDPKRVELTLYNGIPHLLSDVIVDNDKAVNVLKWAVGEMTRRYKILQEAESRDIISYKESQKNGKKRKVMDPDTGEVIEEDMENLPYIVILIDELADLMMSSSRKEIETSVVRIAQMARAVGIHLVISTQRPSVEVITGLIKTNISTRIAFKVPTQIDSRTIIDMPGAEKLLGRGDMLFLSPSSMKPIRIQGVFISEIEVKKIVKFILDQKSQLGIDEKEGIGEDITVGNKMGAIFESGDISSGDGDSGDELYEAAKEEVIRSKKASASLLQRRLRIGYARAARLLDILEENGVVGPADGARPREVYAAGQTNEEIAYEDSTEDQEKRDKWEM